VSCREPDNHDIWAWFATCQRWFACPGWFDRHVPDPHRLVCGAEPRRIENRAQTGQRA
jgi:hypothetical protein